MKKRIIKQHLNLLIFRDDTSPAFAGYVEDSINSGIPLIFLNIHASFRCAVEEKLDAKQILITSLMHEFGHALEDYFHMEHNEEFMDKVTDAFEKEYLKNNKKMDKPTSKCHRSAK